MQFYEKLSKLRKANNLSQEQLAEKLNVTRQAVSKWESGESYPDMAKIIQLCKILNCSLNELMDDGVMGEIEPNEKENVSNVGGIYLTNYADRLNTGKIIKIGFDKNDEYPFSVGDTVMMVKGGDVVRFSDKTLHIFKKDMIVCTIED